MDTILLILIISLIIHIILYYIIKRSRPISVLIDILLFYIKSEKPDGLCVISYKLYRSGVFSYNEWLKIKNYININKPTIGDPFYDNSRKTLYFWHPDNKQIRIDWLIHLQKTNNRSIKELLFSLYTQVSSDYYEKGLCSQVNLSPYFSDIQKGILVSYLESHKPKNLHSSFYTDFWFAPLDKKSRVKWLASKIKKSWIKNICV